jgi:acetolactate synthase-1/3 small subunit
MGMIDLRMVGYFSIDHTHDPRGAATPSLVRAADRRILFLTRVLSIGGTVMRHVLSALVQNQPGVLAHVSGMLASRGFNIDSLAVGETEDPGLSRMTFVVHGDDGVLDQARKQLDKIVSVVRVEDISSENYVERDLMLIKVKASPSQRTEIALLVEMFRARVVDISADTMMMEVSGQESKIEAFIDLMRPNGILELARTGRIALIRGTPKHGETS